MLTSRTKQLKVSQIQVNRIKSTIEHIKILTSRTKQLIKSLLLVANSNFDRSL